MAASSSTMDVLDNLDDCKLLPCQKHNLRRHPVFVSYRSHSDKALAAQLAALLEDRGISAFLDQNCIRHGAEWEPFFLAAIRSAAVIVVILSHDGMASMVNAHERDDSLLLEIEVALARTKADEATLLPVFLGGVSSVHPPLDQLSNQKHHHKRSCQSVRSIVQGLLSHHADIHPDPKNVDLSRIVTSVERHLPALIQKQLQKQYSTPEFLKSGSLSTGLLDVPYTIRELAGEQLTTPTSPTSPYKDAAEQVAAEPSAATRGGQVKMQELFSSPEASGGRGGAGGSGGRTIVRRVVLQGAPGVGKTSLMKQLASKWAVGEMLVDDEGGGYTLVFYLPLQDVVGHANCKLSQLLMEKCLYDVEPSATSRLDEFLQENGKRVLLLLDGYAHEAHGRYPQVIQQIVSGEAKEYNVLVSARPDQLHAVDFDRRLEVCGFVGAAVDQFIDSYFQRLGTDGKDLSRRLKGDLSLVEYQVVRQLAQTPLLAALVCMVWERNKGSFSDTDEATSDGQVTKTRVIKQILDTLQDVAKLRIERGTNRDFDWNPAKLRPARDLLGKLAWKMCISEKGIMRVFDKSEVYDLIGDTFSDTQRHAYDQLGYVHPVGPETLAFVHQDIQEFLAAEHLFKEFGDGHKTGTTIKDIFTGVNFPQPVKNFRRSSSFISKIYTGTYEPFTLSEPLYNVWQFLCGLLGMHPNGRNEVAAAWLLDSIVAARKSITTKQLVLLAYQCCFEAGVNEYKSHLAPLLKSNTCDLSSCSLDASALSALGAVLPKHKIQTLNLATNNYGYPEYRALERAILDCHTLQSINVGGNQPCFMYCVRLLIVKKRDKWHKPPRVANVTDVVEELVGLAGCNSEKLDFARKAADPTRLASVIDVLSVNDTWRNVNLSRNSITNQGIERLCDALESNTTVEEINLKYNLIGPQGAEQLSRVVSLTERLTRLMLGSNKLDDKGLTFISAALGCNHTIKVLDLSSNSIGAHGLKHLSQTLQSNVTLEELGLEQNQIADLTLFADMLRNNRTLKQIRLGKNPFDGESIIKICSALSLNSVADRNVGFDRVDANATVLAAACEVQGQISVFFKNLDLSGAQLKASDFSNARQLMRLAETINVDGNRADFQFLARRFLSSPSCKVDGASPFVEFLLAKKDNKLLDASSECSPEHVESLLHVLNADTETAWQVVRVNKNELDDQSAEILAQCLPHNTAITGLSLSNNDIGDAGAAAFFANLKENTVLGSISLSHNCIALNDLAAEGIKELIAANTPLQVLRLEHNKIGPQGAKAVATGMTTNTRLSQLSLGNNTILDEGAVAIAGVVRSTTNLTQLSLQHNGIGEQGACALAEALLANSDAMLHMDLSGNDIGFAGIQALASAVATNPGLTLTMDSLCLDDPKLEPKDFDALVPAFDTFPDLKKVTVSGAHPAFAFRVHRHFAASASTTVIGVPNIVARVCDFLAGSTLTLTKELTRPGEDKLVNVGILGQTLPHIAECKEVNLSSNELGDDGLQALCEHLPNWTQVNNLLLDDNQIGEAGALDFFAVFNASTTLNAISFKDNAGVGLKSLSAIARKEATVSLGSLDLSGGDYAYEHFVLLEAAIACVQRAPPATVKVDGNQASFQFGMIQALPMCQPSVDPFVASLAEVAQDDTLDLSNHECGNTEKLGILVNILVARCPVAWKTIDLSLNSYGTEEAALISDLLAANCGPNQLLLAHNFFDEAADKIAAAVANTTTVSLLSLEGSLNEAGRAAFDRVESKCEIKLIGDSSV